MKTNEKDFILTTLLKISYLCEDDEMIECEKIAAIREASIEAYWAVNKLIKVEGVDIKIMGEK